MNKKVETKTTDLKKNIPKIKRSFLFIWALLTIGGGYFGSYLQSSRSTNNNSTTTTRLVEKTVTSESKLINGIAKNVGQSVVSINVVSTNKIQNFFGYGQDVQQQGAGTGVIISEDGLVVTNRHVVPAGTTNVTVIMSDGTELTDVKIIGRTASNDSLDIAFIKIGDKKGKKLVAAKLGESAKMEVGDQVVAIGNTLGRFQNTVTTGIISGFNRDIEAGDDGGGSVEALSNLLQTDAAINQGNSGGPLVNIDGQVIGINVAIAGNAQNVGFAIPVDDIKGLVKTVSDKGKLEKAYIGIRYASITDDFAYKYNLPVKRGAYIIPTENGQRSILEDSPAKKAGLEEKDIIIEISGVKLDEKNSLSSIINRKQPGDEIELKIMRDDKEITKKVTLEKVPES